MIKWLKKTALWIFALPILSIGLGAASNQIVLKANHDRFPVMWNDYKVASYAKSLQDKVDEDKETFLNPKSKPYEREEAAKDAEQAMFDLEALKDEGFIDDTHVVMTSDTHLNLLGDWIDLHALTFSPGDLLYWLGLLGLGYAPVSWVIVVLGKLNKGF